MKQKSVKKCWERRGFGTAISLLGAVVFIVGASIPFNVRAQELIPLTEGNIKVKEKPGISTKEVMDAVEEGGLAVSENLALENGDSFKSTLELQPVPESSGADPKSSDGSDALNTDSFEYFEAQGGLVAGAATKKESEEPTIFKLAARFLDRVIFKNYTEFSKSPLFKDGIEVSGIPTFDKDTAGYAIIKKGNQDVVVTFDSKYDTPPVVTAALSLQQYKDPEVRAAAEDLLLISDVKFIVTNVTKKGFQIMMDRKADSDIPFSWHALAVNDPEIFKKGSKDVKDNGDGEDSAESGTAISVDGNGHGYTPDTVPGAVGESETSSGLDGLIGGDAPSSAKSDAGGSLNGVSP